MSKRLEDRLADAVLRYFENRDRRYAQERSPCPNPVTHALLKSREDEAERDMEVLAKKLRKEREQSAQPALPPGVRITRDPDGAYHIYLGSQYKPGETIILDAAVQAGKAGDA